MSAIFGYIAARLKEPSTWAGLAPVALLVGVAAPEWATISTYGVGIAGALAVLLPEASAA
jgi:hypothetical protein